MEKLRILNIFREFHGSVRWAGGRIGVTEQTVSQWLHNKKTSAKCERELPKLALQLLRTEGECMDRDINGPPARRTVNRMRGRKKGSR